jgi:hypothetical protein
MTEHDKKWNMQCEQLVEYKRINGHCMVPRQYEHDKSLGIWVNTQRKNHNNNKIRLDRKIILNEIGFVWTFERAHQNCDDKIWHQQCKKIVEFKRKNGHCMVPQRNKGDASLGRWVLTQRKVHTKNKLRLDRKTILDEIGFAWKADRTLTFFKPDDKLWHQQYKKLVEYKRKNGHCKVSYKYKDDKSLGVWVSKQRARQANNKMLLDRMELLDALEFVWKVDTVASTINVRGLAISPFDHFTLWADHVSHTSFWFVFCILL